jgi:glucose/arabinose dehydrogenase
MPMFQKVSAQSAGFLAACILVATSGIALSETGSPYLSASNVPMAAGYIREILVSGLEHPWGMAWLPDGSMLITERPGRLRVVKGNDLEPDPIRGLPPVYVSGQGGLLDVTIDPDFSENARIYLSYAHGDFTANRLRVARGVLRAGALTEVRMIYETPQTKLGTQHFGSRFLWLPDKTLLMSVGDGGNPPLRLAGGWIREQAQNLESRLGKILRIAPDGSVPQDNPFAGDKSADPLIWSYGHRNIQGLARDPDSNRVWASEHGALGGDELNLIRKGGNYGWPLVTYSREYFGGTISDQRTRPEMTDPYLVWQVAIAPSGLAYYTADRFPEWRGNLFVGGLISQDVRRIVFSKDGSVSGEEAIRIGARVRDVRQGPDGFLYVLTDESAGRLIRIRPETQSPETAP